MDLEGIQSVSERIRQNISKVFVGKEDVVELVIAALFSSGHVLIEDLPGMGKTLLAKTLAKSIGCGFKRIQFTPDLLPSDVTGIHFYSQKECEFILKKGPVFTNILLADEINRATPRTQSSMLECMEERQVSMDGETIPLPEPFFVIATQNPVETYGTFPLPEAQLDRFLMRLSLGYPVREDEKAILDRFENDNPFPRVEPVVSKDEVVTVSKMFMQVRVHDDIKNYILQIIDATRHSDKIAMGASPRAALALMKASQALAAVRGRRFVLPDDIKQLAVPVLAHRLIVRNNALTAQSQAAQSLVEEIIHMIQVPTEEAAFSD